MEDCGGKGYAEDEEERRGRQEKGKRDARQNPNDKEWWTGKELPPTATEHHLQYEDMVSHPIMCDNGLGNMYNLRENMANSAGE
jgi:hypothetical protein